MPPALILGLLGRLGGGMAAGHLLPRILASVGSKIPGFSRLAGNPIANFAGKGLSGAAGFTAGDSIMDKILPASMGGGTNEDSFGTAFLKNAPGFMMGDVARLGLGKLGVGGTGQFLGDAVVSGLAMNVTHDQFSTNTNDEALGKLQSMPMDVMKMAEPDGPPEDFGDQMTQMLQMQAVQQSQQGAI